MGEENDKRKGNDQDRVDIKDDERKVLSYIHNNSNHDHLINLKLNDNNNHLHDSSNYRLLKL